MEKLSRNAKIIKNTIEKIGFEEFMFALEELIDKEEVDVDYFSDAVAEIYEDGDCVNFLSKFPTMSLVSALDEKGDLIETSYGVIDGCEDYIVVNKRDKMYNPKKYREKKIDVLRLILDVNHIAGKEEIQESLDELLKYVR